MSMVGKAGYKESEIGWIPTEWQALTLDNCALVTMGQSPAGDTYNNDGFGVPLLNGPTEFTDRYPVKIQWTSAPTKMCQSGDILICVRGSSTGRINISNDEYCIGRGLASIRYKEGFLQNFLVQLLHFSVAEILKSSAGSTFPSVDRKAISSIRVPTPSLPEQQKIATILTAVDDKLDVITRQISATKTLKQGLMQTLFSRGLGAQDSDGRWVPHTEFKDSELGEIPSAWNVSRLEVLSESITVGIATSTTEHYVENGVPLIRNQNIKEDFLDMADLLQISPAFDSQNKSKRVKAGDILTVRTGYPGVSCVVPDEMGSVQTFTTLITRPNIKLVNPNFVSRYFNSPQGKGLMLHQAAGGAQQNINAGNLKKLLVCVPSLTEQNAIAEILKSVDAKLGVLMAKSHHYQAIKRGLMQKLLTGEWRVKLDVEAAHGD